MQSQKLDEYDVAMQSISMQIAQQHLPEKDNETYGAYFFADALKMAYIYIYA